MRSKRAGFTLIELLVVIAIIAVLAAILFPVFTLARNTGTQASCKSNLMQISRAFTMYMDDYSRLAPPNSSGSAQFKVGGWMTMAYNYTKKIEVFKCPGRPEVNFAYTMNEAVGLMQGLPPKTSKVLLIGEAPGCGPYDGTTKNPLEGDADLSTGASDGQNDGWTCGEPEYNPNADIRLHADNWKYKNKYKDANFIFFPGPHNSSNNVLFMDGHVNSYKNWNKDQMTFGWDYVPKFITDTKSIRPKLVTY